VALVVASAALPAPWNLISPARSLQLIDRGIGPAFVLAVLGYLLIAAVATMLVRSRLDTIRRDAIAN